MKRSRLAISIAVIVALALVIYPELVFSDENASAEISFQGDNTTLQPTFTLYVLHEGRPYRAQAPQSGGEPWPRLKLYRYDSVTLISHKPNGSCTNRVIRILPNNGGVDWEIPFKNVNGCETMRWENKGPIKVPADF